MNYDEIISKVADSQGLPKRVVDKSYRAFWRVIREHIIALPLKSELTDEEFLSLQPNVNIPSIGKLYVTLDRYKRMKRLYEKFNNLKKKE
jgi:hypothetical protein